MPLLTFQQALDRVDEGELPGILIGNGFSRAWRNDIFNYANLLDVSDFGARNGTIRELFRQINTYDFEAVMRMLESALLVLDTYDVDEPLRDTLRRDQDLLKDALIMAISNTHPALPSEVTNDQYVAVRRCLSRFKEVFSVNHDLLFYWARNMDDLAPEGYRTDDGFRDGPKWRDHGTHQNVHFLHGALHIYQATGGIMKHSFANTGVRLIDQVRNNLDRGRFPLFVAEPTADKKRKRIEHNPYLNYCYRTLGALEGSFFVLGHSIDENDKHIFDKLDESRVDKIFVSIYGDEGSDDNRRSKANALTFLERVGRTVEFFDAETVPLWA